MKLSDDKCVIQVIVTKEFAEKLDRCSSEFGLSRSSFSSLMFTSCLDSFVSHLRDYDAKTK